jgi:transposase
MRRIKLIAHLSTVALKEKLNKASDVRLFRYWQLLYVISLNPGKTDVEYGQMLAMGKDNVYRIVRLYNQHGKNFTDSLQWGGRRKQTSYLTPEEETVLMKNISGDAKRGRVLTFHDIHKKVEQCVGHGVSDDYIWDLFHRQQWKKKAPRPKHPEQNKGEQKAFKKTSLRYWRP